MRRAVWETQFYQEMVLLTQVTPSTLSAWHCATQPASSSIVIETTCSLARLAPTQAPLSEVGCVPFSSRQRGSVGQFGHGNKQSCLMKFESSTARNTIQFLSWHMSALMFQRETCLERKYHSFSAIFAKIVLCSFHSCTGIARVPVSCWANHFVLGDSCRSVSLSIKKWLRIVAFNLRKPERVLRTGLTRSPL